MVQVIVASKNPVKINCIQNAFTKAWPEKTCEFEGISVASGVSDQPKSDEETFLGAKNRAENAKSNYPQADYWVGIEGGVNVDGEEMNAFAWVVIMSRDNIGKSKTAIFYLPQTITELIKQGMELGEADDLVFKKQNSKQKQGAIGILTKGIINRSDYYEQAAIMALIPFMNKTLY